MSKPCQPSRRSLFAILMAWIAYLLGPRQTPAAAITTTLSPVPSLEPQLVSSSYLGGAGFAVPSQGQGYCHGTVHSEDFRLRHG